MISGQDIEFGVSVVVGFGIAVTMKKFGCSLESHETLGAAALVLAVSATIWVISIESIFR